jgi:starch phosphorylase
VRKLYDRYIPSWCFEPELLARAELAIPDAELWAAHSAAKRALIAKVQAATRTRMSEELPILGFARLMTAYKRPDLLFADVERLRAIARSQPFQIVLAGKAHPRDDDGKRLIEHLHAMARSLADAIPIAYLPNYDLDAARLLVAGVDVWLNTPLPPLEASGTSGMKAAINGVPNLSILDGWWIEGCIEGVTGWGVASTGDAAADAKALYDKLETAVLPVFHAQEPMHAARLRLMKGAIAKNAAYFNSHRMMRRYATEAYLR